MSLPVRILFLAHGVVTAAAGVVLIVAPGLIPSTVGIALTPPQYLLPFLLAGAELGVAVISFAATRLTGRAVVYIALGFAVMHLATGALELIAPVSSPVLYANIALRVVVTVLFVLAARSGANADKQGRSAGPE